MNRSIESLRADEIFGAVTAVERATVAGNPFPFMVKRPMTDREMAQSLAQSQTQSQIKSKSKSKSKPTITIPATTETATTATTAAAATTAATAEPEPNRGGGTPEFGRNE